MQRIRQLDLRTYDLSHHPLGDFVGDAIDAWKKSSSELRTSMSCKMSGRITVLQLADSGIRVAAYFTELPSRELLQRKLHDAVKYARAKLASSSQENKDGK